MITLEQMVHRRRVVAQSRRRHRSRPLPLATPPRGAIVQHTALLQGISRELDAAIHDELAGLGVVPARADAADGDAAPRVNPDAVAARLRRLVAKILQRKQLVTALDGVAASVAAHTREQFQRQVRAALGIDLPASNPDFSRVFRDFRTKNTALIKTMAEDKVGRVRRVLHEAGVGTRVEEIAAALQEQTGITDRHAALVARDQVLKLNGQVTEQRHQEAGVTEYIWRTSEDERVRESHRALDGTKHRYDQPPVQSAKGERANPGQFFQCRCTMEPIIEGFDEEFAPGQQYAHGTASPVVWSPRTAAGRGARQAPRAVDEERMRRAWAATRERRAPPVEGSDGPQTVAAPEMPGRAILNSPAPRDTLSRQRIQTPPVGEPHIVVRGRAPLVSDPSEARHLREFVVHSIDDPALHTQAILEVVASVHRVPEVPAIVADLKQLSDGTHARYRSIHGIPTSITTSTLATRPHLETLHEVAHFLDDAAYGEIGRFASETEPVFADVMNAIHETPTVERLRAMRDGTLVLRSGFRVPVAPADQAAHDATVAYALENRELFARAYAQYITHETQHPALMKDLRHALASPGDRAYGSQWDDDEFSPVQKAFRELLRRLSWAG